MKQSQRSKIWIKNSFYVTNEKWYILSDPYQLTKGDYKPNQDSLYKENQE